MFRTVLVAVGISFTAAVAAAQVPEKVPQETNQPCAAATADYTLKQFLPCPAPQSVPPGTVEAVQRPAAQQEMIIQGGRPHRSPQTEPGPGRD